MMMGTTATEDNQPTAAGKVVFGNVIQLDHHTQQHYEEMRALLAQQFIRVKGRPL
jgi:hypothetical protein